MNPHIKLSCRIWGGRDGAGEEPSISLSEKSSVGAHLEFSESHTLIVPSAGGDGLLDRFLDLTGIEAVIVDHARPQLFSKGIRRAKLNGGHLSLEF